MRTWIRDARVGVRKIVARPGIIMVVMLGFALGIGANASTYSFLRAVLSRPLPIRDPGTVVAVLYGTDRSLVRTHAYSDFVHYRDHSHSLHKLSATYLSEVTVRTGGSLQTVTAEFVSPDHFSLLGVSAALGREPSPKAGDRSGAEIPAMLSSATWRRAFGGDPAVLGSTIEINNRMATIVGVAPPEFEGLDVDARPEIWLPLSVLADIVDLTAPARTLLFTSRSNESFHVFGRLESGVGLAEAEIEMRGLHRQLNAGSRRWWAERESEIRVLPVERAQVLPQIRGPVLDFVRVAGATSVLILLVGCLNTTGFLLVRFLERSRETATLLALGATRTSVVRRLVMEVVLVASLGSAAAAVLSRWCTRWLNQATLLARSPVHINADVDWHTAGMIAALSLLAGMAVGLPAAVRASRVEIATALKGTQPWLRLRRSRLSIDELYLAGQFAIALVLVVGAALLFLSVQRALAVDLGFQKEHLQVFTLRLVSPTSPSDGVSTPRAYGNMLERVRGLQGVVSATVAAGVPLGQRKLVRQVALRPGEPPRSVDYNVVAPGYFETMRIRILSGRPLEASDMERRRRVAVVNEAFATRYFSGRSPVGKTFWTPAPKGTTFDYEIIGVAANGKYRELDEAPRPFFYCALEQHDALPAMFLITRSQTSSDQRVLEVRNEVQRSRERILVSQIESMGSRVEKKMLRQRLGAQVLGGASAIAVFLTVMGILSATAYRVERRRKEFGIRMAVGAAPFDVFRQALIGNARVIILGVVLGYALTIPAVRMLESLLFGVRAEDPIVLLAAGGLVVLAGVAASVWPARAAAQVSPMEAMRIDY